MWFRLKYGENVSDIIVVAGFTNCCISPISRVSLVLFSTWKYWALPLPLSTISKTHGPLEIYPRLYLHLWLNIDLLISTVFTLPPNTMLPDRFFRPYVSDFQKYCNNHMERHSAQQWHLSVGLFNRTQEDNVKAFYQWYLGILKKGTSLDWSPLSRVMKRTFPVISVFRSAILF